MGRLFDNRNSFWQFMGRMFDVLILNLLWMLFSLPVLTAGASTTAVYAACFHLLRENDQGIGTVFFHAWKQNWKQSTLVLLFLTVLAVFLLADLWYLFHFTGILAIAGAAIVTILLCLVVLVGSYSFALLSLFENTIAGTLSNALILALRHPVRSLLVLLVDIGYPALTVWALVKLPMISMLLLLYGMAIMVFLNSLLLYPLTERFLPALPEENEPEYDD